MSKDFEGLAVLEVVKLINKKKRRYCKIALNELEDEKLEDMQFRRIRKIFLDNINSLVRSVFIVVGVDIEGQVED